jgi:hypothetical protein
MLNLFQHPIRKVDVFIGYYSLKRGIALSLRFNLIFPTPYGENTHHKVKYLK